METMLATAMNTPSATGRAIASAARIHALASDALAARACVAQLERQVIAARMHAGRMAARLARIESFARRAMAHTTDDTARAALGDIVVTARERDAPAPV